MIEELRSELHQLRTTIAAAEKADAQIQGGLVKALIAARLEILRTTEALVWQRIHSRFRPGEHHYQISRQPV